MYYALDDPPIEAIFGPSDLLERSTGFTMCLKLNLGKFETFSIFMP